MKYKVTRGGTLPPAIYEYYRVEETADGGDWELWCKNCRRGWTLQRPSAGELKPGNVLHLLNHAHSHKPEAKEGRNS